MKTAVELAQKDIRILIQSLQNCMETCRTHERRPDARCKDCDAALELQGRLKKLVAKPRAARARLAKA